VSTARATFDATAGTLEVKGEKNTTLMRLSDDGRELSGAYRDQTQRQSPRLTKS
jgi:hypothetical protein